MHEMKQRFVNAVTNQLAAAPNSTAKAELIEELADNLHHRYRDMVADGVSENEAFERALDELGDVNELVDYLKSLSPEEELPKLTLHPDEGLERLLQDAMDAAKRAMDAVKKKGKLRSTTLRSDDGEFEFHMDYYDDDHGEHPFGEDHEDELEDLEDLEDVFDEDVEDTGIPSEGLRGVEIQTVSGDVTVRLVDDENAPIVLEDYDGLEVMRTDDDVLVIRQETTAASSFFFSRGIFSADVELYLPRRAWEFIRVTSTNGDVVLEDGIDVGRLTVKTASGDLTADCASCGEFFFKSASGDCKASGLTGEVRAETMSGDITIHGRVSGVQLSSMSGDVELSGSFRRARCSSMSGDIRLESAVLPEALDVSSKSGDCQVRIPDGEGFTLRHKTTSGDLRSQFPLKHTDRGSVYLDGGDRTFTMTTVSGDLRLRKF